MSQRLLKKYTRPIDDELLIPVFMGAEGEGDPADDDPADQDESEDEDGDESEEDAGKGSKTETVSREEYEKALNRMKAADRAKTAAEAKAKQYEDKDKNALELATQRIEELEKAVKEKDTVLRTQGLENAFFASNTIVWHNPQLALKELELDGVQNDDGEIDRPALKRAIEKLAKSQPFLVKKDGEENTGKNGRTGSNPSGKPLGKGEADRQKLEKKYPAIRR
jgi:hypothetical protein